MRKGILLSILCLISVLAVACGGDNNATSNGNGAACGGDGGCGGEPASSDPYALYKTKGRKWKTKSVIKMEGMDDMVSYMAYEIKSVADDHAIMVTTMLDKDGKENAAMKPTETEIKFVTAEPVACGTGCAPEIKYETITVEAGEFECMVMDTAGTKSWSSKEFPGLSVKMEGKTMTMELVEWSE